MNTLTPTQQLIVYIIAKHEGASVTSLMKLCYLIDLISVQKTEKKITDLQYVRYHYGPYTKEIYRHLESLVQQDIIETKIEYTNTGSDFYVYQVNKDLPSSGFDKLTSDQKIIVDEVLEMLRGYGAKALTDIAYKTKPMKALGATLGGSEYLNETLNLSAK